jgi:CHAD domain-containing protein
VAALDSSRCRRLLDRLATFADVAPAGRAEPRLGDAASGLVRPLLRAVLRTGRALDADAPPEALHRLRVRVKRLRYALDTLRGLGRRDVHRLLGRLERLQDVLGEHQDAVTETAWLRRWVAEAAPDPASVLGVGAVIQLLATRARKRRARLPRAWRRIDRRRLCAGVLREVGAGDGAGRHALRAAS